MNKSELIGRKAAPKGGASKTAAVAKSAPASKVAKPAKKAAAKAKDAAPASASAKSKVAKFKPGKLLRG
jgi:hypothetical protein